VFVCVRMVGYSELVAEVERNLRNADAVVRFQTVRLDTVVEALDKVTVDPEQVKFARIEAPSPDEQEPTVEERLGLRRGHPTTEGVPPEGLLGMEGGQAGEVLRGERPQDQAIGLERGDHRPRMAPPDRFRSPVGGSRDPGGW